MKNFAVAIMTFWDTELLLFKLEAENKYEAAKLGMLEICKDEEVRQFELEWQASPDYPKTYEEMEELDEISIKVIEL